MTTQTKEIAIHNRAMLVALRISTWTARKYDKKVTKEVTDSHNAVADAGRFNKMLIPGDALSYKALMQLVGRVRTEHYANTLAWSDEGWRLLPTANYATYTQFTRQRKAEFMTLLDDFATEYPSLKQNAPARLNGMYNEADYPPISQIRGKFGFYLDFSPLPANGDFRLDLPASEIARIEADTQSKVTSAVSDAMTDAWKRLFDCVRHIHERLSTPDARFHDTLISNASDLCDVLKRLNVTGDPNLEAMRAEVERYIAQSDPDELRENTEVRQDTASVAEDIIARMSGFYTPEVA